MVQCENKSCSVGLLGWSADLPDTLIKVDPPWTFVTNRNKERDDVNVNETTTL